jgi:hypothetical protein
MQRKCNKTETVETIGGALYRKVDYRYTKIRQK